MKPLDSLPFFLREEAAWRRIRGGEPQPAAAPLPSGACREFLHARVRDNLRSASSWGSGNRFARRFAALWRDVPGRPGLSAIAPQYAAHWLARPDAQKERAAWFFRRACKFADWKKGMAKPSYSGLAVPPTVSARHYSVPAQQSQRPKDCGEKLKP